MLLKNEFLILFFKKVGFYAVLIFAINIALGYWLKTYETVDLKKAGVFFSELRWEEFYNLKKPIDVLILGSSHAYRSYHPETIRLELQTGNQVFNFGSSAQSPRTSYFVLNEVLEKHRPKMVILDLYVMVFSSDDQLDNGRINYHAMQSGTSKNAFLKNGFSFNEKVKLLGFPTYVYRDHFKHKINKLLGKTYLPYGKGQYEKNGFAFNNDTLALAKLQYDNQFSKFEIRSDGATETNLKYLEKIVDRCREMNIPIVFMSSPMPELSVKQIENYEDIFAFFERKANELNVPFYDFNINRIPELSDSAHFYDDDHLNLAGAKVFSEKLSKKIFLLKF